MTKGQKNLKCRQFEYVTILNSKRQKERYRAKMVNLMCRYRTQAKCYKGVKI